MGLGSFRAPASSFSRRRLEAAALAAHCQDLSQQSHSTFCPNAFTNQRSPIAASPKGERINELLFPRMIKGAACPAKIYPARMCMTRTTLADLAGHTGCERDMEAGELYHSHQMEAPGRQARMLDLSSTVFEPFPCSLLNRNSARQ